MRSFHHLTREHILVTASSWVTVMSTVGTARNIHTDECVTRTEYKFTLYDMVAILNVCSTRSTKASIIMLSDSCDVLRTYIYILSYSMRERIEIYPHTY